MMRWCSLQDRSCFDATKKAKGLGLNENQTAELLADLESMKFLDDKRFAESYVSGYTRIKKWGKYKLVNGLRQHGIASSTYQEVLDALEIDEYKEALLSLLKKKKRLNPSASREQLIRYALQKGYEQDVIFQCLDSK